MAAKTRPFVRCHEHAAAERTLQIAWINFKRVCMGGTAHPVYSNEPFAASELPPYDVFRFVRTRGCAVKVGLQGRGQGKAAPRG